MSITQQYLDGDYASKNPTFHIEDSSWKATKIIEILEASQLRPRTVAEVGCGAGEILVQLAPKLPDSTFAGYELSPQGYQLCKERETERIRYYNTDFSQDLTEVFDLVLCIDVIEHIEDCFSFLRGIRPHGRAFVFHIPLDMNMQMVLRSQPMLMLRQKVGHIHYFSKDTALATLQDCGYSVTNWFYTALTIDSPKSFKSKVMRIPRQIIYGINSEVAARVLGGYSLMVLAKPLPQTSSSLRDQ